MSTGTARTVGRGRAHVSVAVLIADAQQALAVGASHVRDAVAALGLDLLAAGASERVTAELVGWSTKVRAIKAATHDGSATAAAS